MYNKYKSYIKEDLFLRPFNIHGIGHTRRVLKLALTLADMKQIPEHEKELLAIAACYHDIGRKGDYVDDGHGYKSYKKFVELNLNQFHHLSTQDLEVVFNLIVHHSLEDGSWVYGKKHKLLYQILKDADALDRIRFGPNDLNPNYLRLEESKGLIELAEDLFINGITD